MQKKHNKDYDQFSFFLFTNVFISKCFSYDVKIFDRIKAPEGLATDTMKLIKFTIIKAKKTRRKTKLLKPNQTISSTTFCKTMKYLQ